MLCFHKNPDFQLNCWKKGGVNLKAHIEFPVFIHLSFELGDCKVAGRFTDASGADDENCASTKKAPPDKAGHVLKL